MQGEVASTLRGKQENRTSSVPFFPVTRVALERKIFVGTQVIGHP